MRFADQTVIITGGAGGLRSAMARAFAAEGAAVVIVDRPGSPGADLTASINGAGIRGSASFAPGDLADLDGTRRLIDGIVARQGASVLVNNAAIYPRREVTEYTTGEWLAVQRVNVGAAVLCRS